MISIRELIVSQLIKVIDLWGTVFLCMAASSEEVLRIASELEISWSANFKMATVYSSIDSQVCTGCQSWHIKRG